jgi:hypothetical protein
MGYSKILQASRFGIRGSRMKLADSAYACVNFGLRINTGVAAERFEIYQRIKINRET